MAGGEGEATGRVIDTAEQYTAHDNEDSESLLIHPAMLLSTPSSSPLHKTEIFGPVVLINAFTAELSALAAANASEYGLYASVYTRDFERALRVAKKLEVGMVGVNCTGPTGAMDLPFGGWKGSGVGR
jgi:aldehyde dehydrogenase (NAD+)